MADITSPIPDKVSAGEQAREDIAMLLHDARMHPAAQWRDIHDTGHLVRRLITAVESLSVSAGEPESPELQRARRAAERYKQVRRGE